MSEPKFIALNFHQVEQNEQLPRAEAFFELLNSRRTVREFSAEPVKFELIEKAIATAGTAPSGANLQPWRFVVVKDVEIKRKIREAAEKEEFQSYHKRMSEKWLRRLAPLGTDENKPFLEIAPYLIVVFRITSFVEDGEEVRSTMEPLIKQLATDFAGKTLLTNEIPRIKYEDAINTYGSDKPDLRYGMHLIDLRETLKNCQFGVFNRALQDGGVVKAICVTGGASLSRSQLDNFTESAKKEGAGGMPYLTVEGGKAVSSIAKFFSESELDHVVTAVDAKDGDLIIFGSDKLAVVNKVLGALRIQFANHFKLKDPNIVALAWIIDFPFYEWDDKAKKLDFGHNPFSMPKGGLEALEAEDKLSIVADQYDMVMNGYEICSGGVRNHNPEVLYKVFGVLGFNEDYVEAKFGAMLNAFKFGAPPHAGCAFGLDRMFMELMSEENIREIVAFPKNGSGVDVMTNSPSPAEDTQLKELSIKIVE